MPTTTATSTSPRASVWPLLFILLVCYAPAWGQICTPTSNCSSGDALFSFSLNGNVLSQNTGCTTGGYSSYTNLTTNLSPGQTNTFSGTLSTDNEGVAIWGDLNRNDTFESNERLFQTTTTVRGSVTGSFTIPAGTASGTLRLRVRIVYSVPSPNDPCGNVSYGETEDYFVTVATPTTYSPYNINVIATSAQLNWNNLGTASSYEVQWREQNTGTWTLLTGITSTTYVLTGLTAGSTYEWQMRPTGTTTWIGGPVVFTTQYPCNAPNSLGTYAVGPSTGQLVWYYSDPASSPFEIQIRVSGATSWSTISNLPPATYGLYTFSNFTPTTTYQWRVRSVCSPYSPIATFTTGDCVAPNSLTAVVLPTFAELKYYNYSLTSLINLQWRQQGTTSWNTVASLTTNSCSLTGLTNNTAYEFQVQLVCTSTQNSTFSPPVSFTTGCLTPYMIYADRLGATGASLAWSSPYTSFGYGSVAYGVVNVAQYRPKLPANSPWTSLTTGNTSQDIRDLTFNTAYETRVQSVCPGPVSSSFTSPPTGFTTADCQNDARSLSRTNTFNSAYFNWSSTSFSNTPPNNSYNVLYRIPGGQWTTISNVPTRSYSLTGLANNTVYEWGVALYCSPTTSSSITLGPSFTTTCDNTFTPSMLRTEGITATSARLSYYNYYVGAAGTYDVRYRLLNTPNWTTVTGLNAYYPLSVTGLTPSNTYEWQAAVRCSPTAVSPFTESVTFVTECRTPTSLYSANEGFSTQSVGFNASPDVVVEIDYRLVGGNWITVNARPSFYSHSLTGLTPGNYEWRVRSNCGNGVYSPYSAIQGFFTTCNTPTQLSAEASSYAAKLGWANIGDGARYNLQWRQGTSGSWNTIPNITRNQYVMTGLTSGAAYQVQVQGVCGAQMSASFSTPTSFTANCPQPANLGSQTYSWTPPTSRYFSWNAVFGVSYVVQWKPQGSSVWNSSPVLDRSIYTLNNLVPGVYDYQVGAVCADGVTTTYRAGTSFTIVAASCSPTPPIPQSGIIGSTMAILGWYNENYSPAYEIRWRPQGNTDWNVATNLTDTKLILRGLQPNIIYEWQVRSLCSTTQNTAFSSLQTFTTRCRDLATGLICVDAARATVFSYPILLPNETSTLFNNLGISSSELAASAEYSWREVGASAWTTGNTVSAGASYTIVGLTNNTAYEYRVRNVCSPTVSSTYSSPASFTTQCRLPASFYGYAPNCNSGYLSWSGCTDGGTTTYTVQYRPLGSGNWLTVSTSNPYYSFAGLSASTTYEFQVQANCGGGVQTSFSNSFTIAIPACSAPPVCGIPPYALNVSNITSSAGSLSWYASTPPVELRWRQGATGAWNTIPSTQNSYYQLTGLSTGTTYDWQVRVTCADPNDFSPVSFFRTVCNIPLDPVSFGIRAESAQVSWGGFYNGTTYEIRYRTGNGAWTTVTTPANATNYALTGLTNNTAYEWQIRTLCGGGSSSDWSHSLFFTTTCPTPTNIFTDRIDATTVRCNWSRSVLNGNYVLQYRQQGSGTWTTVGSITSNSASLTYAITGLTEQTTYEWQVLTDCGNGNQSATTNQPLTFRTLGTAPPCSSMVTVQNGDWTNPATWSCNRVPLATDPVQVLHAVMIPDNNTGRAQRVSYGAGGKVTFGTAARLLLNQ